MHPDSQPPGPSPRRRETPPDPGITPQAPGAASQSRSARLRSTALVAVLCAVLGVGIVTQVRRTGSGDTLNTARPADLVVLLDSLQQREAALRQEIATLESTLSSLQADGQGSQAALAQAQQRARSLAVLVGTAAATGPGLILVLNDPDAKVGPEVLVDEVQELRAAGAEAMQIAGQGGTAVRIGVDSSFTGRAGSIQVDGVALRAPYNVTVIGDPPTLAAALNIPGGVVDTVARAQGRFDVQQLARVEVSALRVPRAPQYARPTG